MRDGVQTDDEGREILTDHLFSNHKKKTVKKFKYMLKHNVTKQSELPKEMRTKKFNQKPLPPRWKTKPTMTVTSMPDDYIHYSQPRSFSVREWARIQSFPDKHIFCGNRTTGGIAGRKSKRGIVGERSSKIHPNWKRSPSIGGKSHRYKVLSII